MAKTNVIIPNSLMIDLELVAGIAEGHWDDNGNWIEETTESKNIRGALFPFKPDDFKNYPEGLLKKDDRKLITKEILKDNDVIMLEGNKYIISSLQDYDYLADVGFYVFRRSINDTRSN